MKVSVWGVIGAIIVALLFGVVIYGAVSVFLLWLSDTLLGTSILTLNHVIFSTIVLMLLRETRVVVGRKE